MMKQKPDLDSPEDFERSTLSELRAIIGELKKKHARRSRSPLIFVETFAAAEKRLPGFERSGWETVEIEITRAKKFVESLRADYLLCLDPAERQRQRNKLWDQIYHPPPPVLGGGRADGNS